MSDMTADMNHDMTADMNQILKYYSSKFINKQLTAPSKSIMQQWLQKKVPQKYWASIKDVVSKFRKTLPVVSHRSPDYKKSARGKRALGQTFTAPSWISADLG